MKPSAAIDPVVKELAAHPEHFKRFFELDQKAIDAIIGLEETGPVRREVYAFQEQMKAVYGRKLTGKDCTLAKLIHAASELRQAQELEVGQTETAGVAVAAAV